jgi:rhamnopyranosyl-N-acetylglucosaminyl-diphospho-decaprenol beta-1,3/1,4-galactofuranosyltransferase
MTVCAAVVTFDRREELLRCLAALQRQEHPVERIVIVDNASTDGTPEALRAAGWATDPRVTYERLPRNTGGAGGFARAVELARATPADWLWLMDDDVQPRPDALARLLATPEARAAGTACLCPAVCGPDGALQTNHRGAFRGRPRPLAAGAYRPGNRVSLGFTTFVAPLVRAEVARRIDPPLAEFFIWCEDYEYSFRLREHGEIVLVPEAVVDHANVAATASTRRSRVLNRLTRPLLGWEFAPAPAHTFWRNLFGVRNYVWLKRRHEHQSALAAATTVAQFVVRSLACDPRPLPRIPWIVRYGLAGRRGSFHNDIPARWSVAAPQPDDRDP